MPQSIAITRAISPALAACELTHLERVPIDVERARAQHRAYEEALIEAGYLVERLDTSPQMPDSVFVEDIAIVFDEVAIITRPGAESRRQETPAVAEALAAYRPLHVIQPPGTVDGGDVLVAGRRVFIGRSSRTNEAAVGQMRQVLEPFGYTVSDTVVRSCLHLKSAVTALERRCAAREQGVDRSRGVRRVHVRRGRSGGAVRPRTRCGSTIGSCSRRPFRARPSASRAAGCGCIPSTRARWRRRKGR